MTLKTIGLSDELHAYVMAHTSWQGGVLDELAAETQQRYPEKANMQIAPEQGAFLTLLGKLTQARFAVEIGTFTGYSAICLARGLAEDGRLVCFDSSEEWASVAARYWEKAGVAEHVELRLGDARETLASLDQEPPVDLAFVDADKPSYPDYYEALLSRLASGGLIVVDNVLSRGDVIDPGDDENPAAIAAFNDQVLADDRVDVVMLPVADGLSLITPRSG